MRVLPRANLPGNRFTKPVTTLFGLINERFRGVPETFSPPRIIYYACRLLWHVIVIYNERINLSSMKYAKFIGPTLSTALKYANAVADLGKHRVRRRFFQPTHRLSSRHLSFLSIGEEMIGTSTRRYFATRMSGRLENTRFISNLQENMTKYGENL